MGELLPDYMSDGSLNLTDHGRPSQEQLVGVDSGRFGVFHEELFHKDSACSRVGFASFQDLVDRMTEPEDESEPLEKPGVVVGSGFGDGCYEVKSYLCEDGRLKAAFVVFVDREQEERTKMMF